MIKQKSVNSFAQAQFKCKVSEEKLKQLAKSFESFRQILHTSQVEIFENSRLFSSKIWETESYVEEGKNFFSLATEIKTEKLTIEKLYRESMIAQIVKVRWPKLIELNLLNCRITSIEGFALLNTIWLTTLNLTGNYITKIRGIVKLNSAKKLSLLVIDNTTLSSQALNEISQANLTNLKKLGVNQLLKNNYRRPAKQKSKVILNYNFILKMKCPERKYGLECSFPFKLEMLLEQVEIEEHQDWRDGCRFCPMQCTCCCRCGESIFADEIAIEQRSRLIAKGFIYK